MTAATTVPLRRNPEYVRWLTGDILLDIGAGIASFAFPLVTLTVTGSAGAVGMVGLIQGIGALLGLIPGGILADRFDRRRLRILAALTGTVTQSVFVAVLVVGHPAVPVLAAIAFVHALRGGLLNVASDPMLKQIVPPAQLPRAFAINEGRGAAVELGAGPAGGALLAVHLALPALTLVITQIGSLIATLTMHGDYRPRTAADAPAGRVRDDLSEARHWCMAQPVRVQMATIALLANLGSNGVLLTVTLMLASRGVPATQIGVLSSVLSASILLGSICAPKLLEHVPTGVVTVTELVVLALSAVALPFAPNVWVIGGIYALLGVGIAPLNAAAQGYFMHITPTEMQGRIGSLMGLVSMGLMPLAPALAGWGLERVGPVPTMLLFAVICAAAALIALLGRSVRRIPVAARWQGHAAAEGLVPPDPAEDPAPLDPQDPARVGERFEDPACAGETQLAADAPLRARARRSRPRSR
jgi:MFS family permease